MNKALFTGIITMYLMATSAFATTDTKPVSQWKCEDFWSSMITFIQPPLVLQRL